MALYLDEVVDALLDEAQEVFHVAVVHPRGEQLLVPRLLVLRHLVSRRK